MSELINPDIASVISDCKPYNSIQPLSDKGNLKEMVEQFEYAAIQTALETCHFSKTQTAKQLGISINTLWRKMRNDSGVTN